MPDDLKCCVDKNKTIMPQVNLFMARVPSPPDGTPGWMPQMQRPSPLTQDTPSESSEAENSEDDTNEEDGWDSGECSLIPINTNQLQH